MFELVTGPFRKIEEAALSDLAAAKKEDPFSGILVLSPSGHMLSRIQKQLTKRPSDEKTKGFLNIHFLTFYALAERLLADAGYTERIVIEPAFQQELIRQVLTGETPEEVDLLIRKALHLDGKTQIPQGLAGALAATLRDLRDSGMRVDDALKAAQEGFLGQEAPEAASTLALYGRITGLFQKYKLRTSADLLRRAAEHAPNEAWIQKQKAIFLYGFYDLTGVQLDLILSLSNHPNAKIYFPYEEGNPAYAYAEKLLQDPAFVSKCADGRRAKGEGRKNIVPVTPRPSPFTEVWSCSGARDEVWLAAKEILKLVDDGIPFNEIGVVSRNLTPYLTALQDIFGAHHIPYNSSRAQPAGTHPLIKTIQALLTLDARHPSAKILSKDLEKSPYIRMPSPPSDSLAAGNDAMASWASHIQWADELIRRHIHLPSDFSAEESGLLNTVLESLEELKILETLNINVSRNHFLDTWQRKLNGIERPAPKPPHAGVEVLEVQQARGLSFRVLFVLGMNEKVFPRLIREDPFLSDAARSALAQATGCRLGRKLDGYEEERFLFELTRQAATDHLYLITERSDEEGKTLIPSVYLKEIERATPGLKPSRLPRTLAEKFENRTPLIWTPKELSLLMNRAQLDTKPVYEALGWNVAAFYKLLATHRAMESFKPGIGPYDGHIEGKNQLKPILSKPFSPSSLEDLAECPFQYYSAHVLRIKPEEDLAPDGEITPKALGKLFHKSLELFYTTCRDKGWPQEESQVTEGLKEAIEASFSEFSSGLSTIYPLMIKSSKNIILKELSQFIKSEIEEFKETGYRPGWFEQPLEGILPLPGLAYRFFGKPDRLDTRQDAGTVQARIVDYKSGKPKPWTGRIETQIIQGKFLQLPIYLGLASAFLQNALGKPVTVERAILRPLRESDDEAIEKTLTPQFWSSPSAPLFAENIREMIGLIEKGEFYIEPSTGDWGYCTRCDFAKVCHKEHMPSRIRAERDPLRQRVSEKLAQTAPAADKKALAREH